VGDPLRRQLHCACSPACRWSKKGDPNSEALGRSKGGFSTKVHVRCEGEGKGKPVVFELTPGEQHVSTVFELLMEGGAIKKPGRGRPRRLPFRIAADKAYSSKRIRGYLARRGIGIIITQRVPAQIERETQR
jgi:hypothetical protein